MTVAEELMNRSRYRDNLQGVLVSVDGTEPPISVAHTAWNKDSELVVTVVDGRQLPAERCHLRSKWPVGTIKPSKHNEWNSTGRKWYKQP